VLTGGEPALQFDEALKRALHDQGFEIAIETNGTVPLAALPDWVCVSPKEGADLIVRHGDEIKVVVPQVGQELSTFEQMDFSHHFLQPMDGPDKLRNTELAIATCKNNPQWRLSIQTHKLLQIP
jgi:organic radical activating enzyme